MHCGLILENPRGLSAKYPKKPVSRVHGAWTTGTPVHHGPAAIAALGSSPELGLQPLRCPRALTEGGREGGRAGELNGAVAVAQEAVEGRLTGDGKIGSEGRQ
jgi:hypothetical protein